MKYFAMIDGERRGPFTLDELVTAGVGPDTYVWCKDMSDWQKAGEVADICRFWRRRLAGEFEDSSGLIAGPRRNDRPLEDDEINPAIGRRMVIGPENDRMINPLPESMMTPPPGGMPWAILTTLLCFPLTGFVAVYMFWLSGAEWKQAMASEKEDEARRLRTAAWDHSRQGRMWTGITFFLGLIFWAFMMRFTV